MLNKIFKKPNGELNFINISVVVGITLFVLTILMVFLFIGEDEQSIRANSDDLNIDTGIPAKHQNVSLEKDKEVTYVTQNEVEKIVSRAVTSEMDKIHLEIDKNQKENLDTINTFQNNYDKKINEEIKELEKDLKEEVVNNKEEVNIELIKEEIKKEMEKENEKLRERIEELNSKIAELEEGSLDLSSSDNERNIELPGNDYGNNVPEPEPKPEPEPEVKTETKIVYRDRIVEKEPEPKPEPKPQKTYIPFTLDGIFAGQNNIAVISENGNSKNIKEGNNYKQFNFKKINDNSVVVAVNDREIKINMNDGGREF